MIQDQDFHYMVLEAPRNHDPGLEDYIAATHIEAVHCMRPPGGLTSLSLTTKGSLILGSV